MPLACGDRKKTVRQLISQDPADKILFAVLIEVGKALLHLQRIIREARVIERFSLGVDRYHAVLPSCGGVLRPPPFLSQVLP